jgi:hypothetical protein
MIDQSHPLNPSVRLHPECPESGEWVRFRADLPADAHVTPDGYKVGIYVRHDVDTHGNEVPEHIAPVDTKGNNVFIAGQQVRLDPKSVTELHHLEDRTDIPADRIAKSIAVHPEIQTAAWHRRQAAVGKKAIIDAAKAA